MTAWMCALLLAVGTLLPLVSQAGSRLFGTVDWIELCTTNGMERVAVGADGQPVEEGEGSQARCPVCTYCAKALALPVAPTELPADSASYRPVRPHVLIEACVTRVSHFSPHPRAPPATAG